MKSYASFEPLKNRLTHAASGFPKITLDVLLFHLTFFERGYGKKIENKKFNDPVSKLYRRVWNYQIGLKYQKYLASGTNFDAIYFSADFFLLQLP
jgi:hypothetical protein